MDIKLRKLIEEIANKHNLPKDTVKYIILSQFRYTHNHMKYEYSDPIQWLSLGKVQLLEKKYNKHVSKKIRRDKKRLEKLDIQDRPDRRIKQQKVEGL